MRNALCDMMGIRYPILLGGMLFVGRARLVAAVSRAGGLGILGAGAMKPEELREEIGRVRAITDCPFGVNIPIRSPGAQALAQVTVEESVNVVSTSAGSPFLYTHLLKENKITVIHVVPTVAHAVRAQEAGVDAIVAEGSESGGYINLEEVTTLALVPQVVDAVKVPVIAAGGIADARGLVATLALGAAGIQMGTRFLATPECEIPQDYKRAILMATDTDTIVVRGDRTAHRDLKKELIDRVMGSGEGPSMEVEELLARFERGSMGDPDERRAGLSVRSAGQSAGLVREVLPAEEVINRIMKEAAALMASLPEKLPR